MQTRMADAYVHVPSQGAQHDNHSSEECDFYAGFVIEIPLKIWKIWRDMLIFALSHTRQLIKHIIGQILYGSRVGHLAA